MKNTYKNLEKNPKNPKNLEKISKIPKIFRKISLDLNLCHFFSSNLPLDKIGLFKRGLRMDIAKIS